MRSCIAGTPIVTRFGRHFHHEVVTNRNKSAVRRSALSFLPQSTSSDIMLTAYMDMRDHLATTDLDWRFRALVHDARSEEHTSELQSRGHLVCRLLLEKKKTIKRAPDATHRGS